MTQISLHNFKEGITKSRLTKAQKLTVREAEKSDANSYTAFVDEKESSFDVSLKFDDASNLISSECECGAPSLCIHELALLHQLAEETVKKKKGAGRAKRLSEADLLLSEINSEELKTWLSEFFRNNKVAELQFVLEMGAKPSEFSAGDVKEIIKKAISSVIGRRKSITVAEAKKLSDLLTQGLQPVRDFIFSAVSQPVAFELYQVICLELTNFEANITSTSSRIKKFRKQLGFDYSTAVNKVSDEKQWQQMAVAIYNTVLTDKKYIPVYLYELALNLYDSAGSAQKLYLAEKIRTQIQFWIQESAYIGAQVKKDFLDIIIEHEMFDDTEEFFEIIDFENDYNLKILREYMIRDRARAETLCLRIINSNYYDHYNEPYYGLLKMIYKDNGDVHKLAVVMKNSFELNPDIEDYIFIRDNFENKDEFAKFRSKVLGNLRRNFYGNPQAAEVYFGILESEGNYKKMLEVIDENVAASVLIKYMDRLFLISKEKLILALRNRGGWRDTDEEIEVMTNFLVSHYDRAHLHSAMLNTAWGSHSNKFARYVLEKLKSNAL